MQSDADFSHVSIDIFDGVLVELQVARVVGRFAFNDARMAWHDKIFVSVVFVENAVNEIFYGLCVEVKVYGIFDELFGVFASHWLVVGQESAWFANVTFGLMIVASVYSFVGTLE